VDQESVHIREEFLMYIFYGGIMWDSPKIPPSVVTEREKLCNSSAVA
jgi:hypothetical protein